MLQIYKINIVKHLTQSIFFHFKTFNNVFLQDWITEYNIIYKAQDLFIKVTGL